MGIKDCNQAAELGDQFTADMQDALVTNCTLSCFCSVPISSLEEECTDDISYLVNVLGTDYDCTGVVVALGSLGASECSEAAETAAAIGQPDAFTAEMEALL
eukprot:gene19696-23561_t